MQSLSRTHTDFSGSPGSRASSKYEKSQRGVHDASLLLLVDFVLPSTSLQLAPVTLLPVWAQLGTHSRWDEE